MTIDLSARTRAIVADTLPLIEQNRARLEQALDRNLARRGLGRASDVTGQELIGALLHLARQRIAGSGSTTPSIDRHMNDAARLADHAWMGNVLAPIMRDALGAKVTPSVVAAWGDAYWALVRLATPVEVRLAA